jgi:hypothetical protein
LCSNVSRNSSCSGLAVPAAAPPSAAGDDPANANISILRKGCAISAPLQPRLQLASRLLGRISSDFRRKSIRGGSTDRDKKRSRHCAFPEKRDERGPCVGRRATCKCFNCANLLKSVENVYWRVGVPALSYEHHVRWLFVMQGGETSGPIWFIIKDSIGTRRHLARINCFNLLRRNSSATAVLASSRLEPGEIGATGAASCS